MARQRWGSGEEVRINNFARACLLALACCLSPAAVGQEKTGNKEGFALKPGTVKIVLMRPVIGVGEQSTGGLYEPNADWTTQTRGHLGTALSEAQTQLGNQIVTYGDKFRKLAATLKL
jgi:hypothetical protein